MPDHASGKTKTPEEIEDEISPLVKDLKPKKIEDQDQVRYKEEV